MPLKGAYSQLPVTPSLDGDSSDPMRTLPPRKGVRTRSRLATRSTLFAVALVITLSLLISSVLNVFSVHAISIFKAAPKVSHEECRPCNPSDELCSRWGSQAILRSRSYEGSGHQIAPFLEKVVRGADIKIGFLGGSITDCIDSEIEDCFVNRLMKDLGTDLASYGGKVDFINGAVPAVGSPFFAACGVDMFVGEVDLMRLELSVNDQFEDKDNPTFEAVIRELKGRKNPPALLIFNMWSPLTNWSNGSPGINSLAQYYDIPVVSHRNVIYQQRIRHPESADIGTWFAFGRGNMSPGGHHPSAQGHALSADILLSWFRQKLCEHSVRELTPNRGGKMKLDLPTETSLWSSLHGPGDDSPYTWKSPLQCFGPNTFGPRAFPISQSESYGFHLGSSNGKKYIAGHNMGDRAVFDLVLKEDAVVTVMFWMGIGVGLGRARVWLDHEEAAGSQMWGDYSDPKGVLGNGPIKTKLINTRPAGPRKLFVEIIEGTGDPDRKREFRISSIVIS